MTDGEVNLPQQGRLKPILKHKKDFTYKHARIVHCLAPHNGSIWALATSPDGKYVASGGEDKLVKLFSIFDRDPYLKQEESYVGHESDIVHLSWSNDNFLLSSSLDSTVRLWHPTQKNALAVFQHEDAVTSAVFKPRDSRVFVACTFGLSAFIWNIKDNSILQTIRFNSPPTAVTFSPDATKIVVGCFNGFCYFYNTNDYSYITQFIAGPRHKKLTSGKKITSILFVQDDLFLVATNDNRIRLYSMQNYSVVRKYLGHVSDEAQLKLSLSPNAEFIMAASETKGRVCIWPIDHENLYAKGGIGSSFKRDRSDTMEGFTLGKNVSVNSAIFTNLTTENHLHALVSDNQGRIYTVVSD
ncbi:WD repeat-containing protein 5 [Tritrichomonas foetus]|uniref:WD repeat-containing protein 5 n=1 Tax=Tritrichomonas foetus TaxID=1144522 RepID=A0A1J4JI13_9EUKA|nr:WD repeat-containing protein 5 [Tritrichomonas foetus]|eukprot:OHS98810.1 WD repeat-containing protein 5 [Tritrichomonas foetus]